MSDFSLTIDDLIPETQYYPTSESDVVEIVNDCVSSRNVLVPVGGKTSLQTGNLLETTSWNSLSSSKLDTIIDFSPDDMVITVGVGTTLNKIQETLSEAGQFLPIDCAYPNIATIGGIIATNSAGDWRPEFGTPRDRLLGLRVVLADGSVVRAGGKVVKNVAGYDLCKLFAGSWGTLGFITEATFKTNPIPAVNQTLYFEAANIKLATEAALKIHWARLQPVGLQLVSNDTTYIRITLMGSEEAVNWQRNEISSILTLNGLVRVGEKVCAAVVTSGVKVKISVRPTELPEALSILEPYCTDISIQIPTGIIEATLESADDLLLRDSSLRSMLPAGSQLVWKDIPLEFKRQIDIWGMPRPEWKIMKSLKHTMDPINIFSPGRFVGRI